MSIQLTSKKGLHRQGNFLESWRRITKVPANSFARHLHNSRLIYETGDVSFFHYKNSPASGPLSLKTSKLSIPPQASASTHIYVELTMSLVRFYYDPLVEFDSLFDDAFASRFRPLVSVANRHHDLFRPR